MTVAQEPESVYPAQGSDMSHAVRMARKVPPSSDGTTSWFDWLSITTLPAEKHGPSLKNALVGSAAFCKNMLNNETLRDPDLGVAHFKDVLRPFYVKGVNHVFLLRFLQLFRQYWGNQEFVQWIRRFEVAVKRVTQAWAGLADITVIVPIDDADFPALLTDEQKEMLRNLPAAGALLLPRRFQMQSLQNSVVVIMGASLSQTIS